MKVSVLGPEGSYSEMAARSLFSNFSEKPAPVFLFCSSIENTVMCLFEENENGYVSNCAVIPIENSIEGAVGVSMDLLLEKEVAIVAEMVIPIHHCLLVSSKTASDPNFSLDKIQILYSHPQGLYQCRSFIRNHLKNAAFVETDSTSLAAKRVSEMSLTPESPISAAIASKNAEENYGLKSVHDQIQDNPNNSTRFLFLIRSASFPKLKSHSKEADFHILPENLSQTGSGQVFYKTSLVTSTQKDKPGALFHILEAFFKYNINLTRIESRPSKKALGEYYFYIDFEGNPAETPVSDALDLVRQRSSYLKILGTYGQILSNRQ